MDSVRLVESGEYTRAELNAEDKTFICGMEYVRDAILDENFFDDGDFETFSPTLSAIQKEVAYEVIKTMREYVYVAMCDEIVSRIDSYEEGANDKD